MKILVFTEGTVVMHKSGLGLDRTEIVRQSTKEGVVREAKSLFYGSKTKVPTQPDSVHDYVSYVPNGSAVEKLRSWKNQGAQIYYLSSRRIKSEVEAIKMVLKRFNFPDCRNLLYRKHGQEYADVAEELMPDILIEDDCESIGGESEMTYPHIRLDVRSGIKSVVVREFGGIDHLPDSIAELQKL